MSDTRHVTVDSDRPGVLVKRLSPTLCRVLFFCYDPSSPEFFVTDIHANRIQSGWFDNGLMAG